MNGWWAAGVTGTDDLERLKTTATQLLNSLMEARVEGTEDDPCWEACSVIEDARRGSLTPDDEIVHREQCERARALVRSARL